ncbi:MAG TPA: YsnF/AvaK domain-containing protein [Trueperaceae bacterium]
MAKTVIGLFDHLSQARRAVDDLVDNGFDRDTIDLVANASPEDFDRYLGNEGTNVRDATPDRGQGFGGWLSSLFGGPVDRDMSEDAGYFVEGVRRGGTLVSIRTTDDNAAEAAALLERHNPVDIEERSGMWRERGWQGYDQTAGPYNAEQIERERGELNIPVVEEEVRVGKREVERGGVRVRTYVTETPFEENVELRDETIHVDRQPVDRPASEADMNAFREGSYEFTETDEEAIVEKRPHVVEEVHVGKDVQERTETVRGTTQRKDVEVEQVDADQAFDRYEPQFRQHWGELPASRTYSYDQARPAYRYGYNLANSESYRDRGWDEIEPEARREWENRNEGTWEDFREPVHRSWEEVRNRR